MRALKAEFELSNNLHVLARASVGECDRFEIARERVIQRTARKYENRGNEAKKCLKTKDITFFNAANSAHFARTLSAIEPPKDQTTPDFAKTRSGLAIPMRCYDTDKKSARQPRDSHGCRPNLDSGSRALSTDWGAGILEAENLPRANNVCVTLRNCGKPLPLSGGTALI
jgi:hypothetical protein